MASIHHLVIGGTKGIGKQLVKLLVADEGNNVTVIGRTPNYEQNLPNLKEYAANASDHQKVIVYIKEAISLFGKVDSVVFMQRHRSQGDEFDLDIEVGVAATKKITDHLVKHQLFTNTSYTKSIVMVSSIADTYIAEEQPAGYHVAKAGLVQLSRYFALKLGPIGIRVNAVSPCVVMKIEAREYYAKQPDLLARFARFIPLGRMGDPDDIANTIMFLASEKASYITGQNIVVDGGLTLRSHESLIRDSITL